MSPNDTLYLFFALPRSGNHWVEMMIGGLYYTKPILFFDMDGHKRKDVGERYGTGSLNDILRREVSKPYLPPITRENPVLYLEWGQPLTSELKQRSEEIDLKIVRDLIHSSEKRGYADIVPIQWFHGSYHAPPLVPISLEGIAIKYIFLMRSPQDMAFSLYRVWTSRWDKYMVEGIPQRKRDFFDFYTKTYLENMREVYNRYNEFSKKYDSFTFRYESLLQNSSQLDQFCKFVGKKPKLPVDFVWKQSRLNSIVGRSKDRTFYRMAGENAWMREFSRTEIERMKQVEDGFDFSEIRYKNTCNLSFVP
jgi:hypothetical protein